MDEAVYGVIIDFIVNEADPDGVQAVLDTAEAADGATFGEWYPTLCAGARLFHELLDAPPAK